MPFGCSHYASLLTGRDGAVALISLNRPRFRNALDAALRAELRHAIGAADRDDEVGAIVVTGEGEAFCAGGDIGDLARRSLVDASWAADRVDAAVEQCGKPVVGALHGYVIGGGLELALAFTLRVAADNATFALTEIELGIFPGLGGTQRLARVVGEARALDLVLTARRVDPAAALAMGLVTRVVPAAELRPEAIRLAQRLAEGPSAATRIVVDAVRRAGDACIPGMPAVQSMGREGTWISN